MSNEQTDQRFGSNLTDKGIARTIAARFNAEQERKRQPKPEQMEMTTPEAKDDQDDE